MTLAMTIRVENHGVRAEQFSSEIERAKQSATDDLKSRGYDVASWEQLDIDDGVVSLRAHVSGAYPVEAMTIRYHWVEPGR